MRPLKKGQRKAFYYCKGEGHPSLFMEMRTGKSIVVARSITTGPVLIVAPYSALFGWQNELLLENIPQSEILLITGTTSDRKEKIKHLRMFNLINWEAHLRLPEIAGIKWSEVVLDESTCIKDPTTKISKFFTDNFRQVKRRWALTGVPAPENELNYFQQLKYVNSRILPVNNYYSFRNKYFTQTFAHEYCINKEGEQVLSRALHKHCFFLTRKEAGLNGEKIYQKRYIELNRQSMKSYKKLAKLFVMTFGDKILNVTDNAGALYSWLRQICSGWLRDDSGDLHLIDDSKAKELIYLCTNELKNSQIIVFCEYLHELQHYYTLLRRFTETRIINGSIPPSIRSEICNEFQEKRIRIVIVITKCLTYGSLMSMADTAIYCSSPTSSLVRSQSEDRIINPIVNDDKLIIDMIAKNTVEDVLYQSLINKETRQETMRKIIKSIREVI